MMNEKLFSLKVTFWSLFLCVLSAFLLILSFPPYNFSLSAWFALVPFLLALEGKTKKNAFLLGWLTGVIFFVGTMYWFFYLINWFGWIAFGGVAILLIYLGIYLGVFGLSNCIFSKEKMLLRGVLTASSWVALDFIRSKMFTGFDWGSLGHTQYRELPLIQIADITGVFGISFLIVFVNFYFKEIFLMVLNKNKSVVRKSEIRQLGLLVALMLLLTVGYGFIKLNKSYAERENIKIAVVQGNISQDQKWSAVFWPNILTKYMSLTDQALNEKPELIIWPETSFPGIMGEDDILWNQLTTYIQKIKTPVLVGVIEKKGQQFYNSAVLISSDGKIIERYRKMHLVPFGEFFPFRFILGSIADMLDIGDFTKGHRFTIFPLGLSNHTFSVLICFEDTVSYLARRFVQQKSQLLINITNDAWFGDTNASLIHMQNAVFRSVENRRSLVRAANTGLSCFINDKGKILKGVEDKARKATFIDGYSIEKIVFNEEKTFYTIFGDVFAYLCFACILGTVLRKRILKGI